MKINLIVLFIVGLGFSELHAQKATVTTGGNASGSGGSISYSVGQIVYKTYNGSTGNVVQGVQQPYEVSVITGLEEAKDINLVMSAYPNPTSYGITLKVENYKIDNLTYQLYDINGKLLLKQKIKSVETPILMEMLDNGTYFLKVISYKTALKSLKIIKNK
jgi:hypothetical protein